VYPPPQLIRIGGTNFFRSLHSRIHYCVPPPIMELVAPPLAISCSGGLLTLRGRKLSEILNQSRFIFNLDFTQDCAPSDPLVIPESGPGGDNLAPIISPLDTVVCDSSLAIYGMAAWCKCRA